MKKMDGKDCYELRYRPKKSTDADILLYFDAATFQHVATVYSVRLRAQLAGVDPNLATAVPSDPVGPTTSPTGTVFTGGVSERAPGGKPGVIGETNETASAHQQETRYRLEEHFDSFETVGGLTLPTHYTIHFSQELGSGRTTVAEWAIIATQTTNGGGVDARNFEVK
jgi:hypothetical protein